MKRNYYFFKPGILRRSNNTIVFEPYDTTEPAEDENLQDSILLSSEKSSNINIGARKIIPINDIDSIFILSNVNFNSRFIEFAATNYIPVHIFNYYGYYKGTFYPFSEVYSGTFILKQCSFYLKYQRRLVLAKKFVEGAAHNILQNLARYISRGLPLQNQVAEIRSLLSSADSFYLVPQLMFLEGQIRKIYYSTFNLILDSEIKFTKRQFHPPPDPMNALISFANALVYSLVISEIFKTHLNPFISFLHEPGEKRFSLAYDIAEIFKPILADRIIFKLLNTKRIKLEHFEYKDNACYLNNLGRKIFVEEFDTKLNKTILHRKIKRNISYRRLVRLECYNLVRHIKKEAEYKPFKIWW
ncbi:MAG: type I-B CRISPR-associated endonuclease Cas1b [Ignavibacteria bacterium]|nr:type I-B CRISPR-associated endonuclease Cas1b [Ignavibacteria bacterium]